MITKRISVSNSSPGGEGIPKIKSSENRVFLCIEVPHNKCTVRVTVYLTSLPGGSSHL